MRPTLCRVLCALLCLCLLPMPAMAEQPAAGMRFDLSFSMDASSFPAPQQSAVQGIADLMNVLHVQGTLETAANGCFDLNGELTLNQQAETRTTLRLFGTPSHWGIQSSLLGDEMLMVNMIALLEFSIKAYFHLNLPLQYPALLISPYVHTSALDDLISAWQRVMLARSGSRSISRNKLLSLAQSLSAVAESDRTFQYWVQALALDAGYDEDIMDFMATLSEWVKTSFSSKGITVNVKGGTETWKSGDTLLFIRTTDANASTWNLTLPTTLNGYDASASCISQADDHTLQLNITGAAQESVLNCLIKASDLPDVTGGQPVSAPFSLEVRMSGKAVKNDVHLLFEGEGQDGRFELRMLEPASRTPQLTVSGTLSPYPVQTAPNFSSSDMLRGVNLLSINDVTLTELLGRISSPLLKGGMPLLVHIPATSMAGILDLMTEHGIIDLMLSGGASSMEEEYYD